MAARGEILIPDNTTAFTDQSFETRKNLHIEIPGNNGLAFSLWFFPDKYQKTLRMSILHNIKRAPDWYPTFLFSVRFQYMKEGEDFCVETIPEGRNGKFEIFLIEGEQVFGAQYDRRSSQLEKIFERTEGGIGQVFDEKTLLDDNKGSPRGWQVKQRFCLPDIINFGETIYMYGNRVNPHTGKPLSAETVDRMPVVGHEVFDR